MNDFSDLPLKHTYDSGEEDILWDFYIPVLSKANQYDRIAGFFSSSILAAAAKGMSEFIRNGGHMRLVTCPMLSKEDVNMLQDEEQMDQILTANFIRSLSEVESQFMKDHVKAMGWMLAKGLLEIRIAVIRHGDRILDSESIEKSGIMHQKVGILYDQCGNIISFSGSNNESYQGWIGNTEEFKVFCSWDSGHPYYKDDISRFESFWNGTRKDVKVISVPEAIKEKLIKESRDFSPDNIRAEKYYPQSVLGREKEPLRLFYYQENAVKEWNDNHRCLLLQMATGCGKTRTAIGCMTQAIKDTNHLLIVIATPQSTLSAQWKRDIDHLDVPSGYEIEINGSVSGWKALLRKEIMKLKVKQYPYLIVYTTHAISCKQDFLDEIKRSGAKSIRFLIGDEVHGMGAKETRNALDDCYQYRLGLSATPERWFDESGSKIITDYFGGKTFEFGLQEALSEFNPLTMKHFLVQYEYHPYFVHLTDDELEKYERLTEKITKASFYTGSDDDYLQMMLFQRANIEKNAEEKYGALEKILDSLGKPETIRDTILFVSDEQIDRVISILGARNIRARRFTQAQGTKPSEKYGGLTEREYIIKMFKDGQYQVLVAIKCLDEGIDIPSASRAVVMASSTNPREYVQRIGRVIRQAPGKNRADIYDLIIQPDLSGFQDEKMKEMEKRIFEKEMVRVLDLASNAINNVDVVNTVYEIKGEVLHG